MRRLTFLLVISSVAAAVLTTTAARQTQPFRVGTRNVPVYATVTDAQGEFLLNLKKEEFEIRDNGKVVPITQFITDLQPLSVVVLIDGSASMWDVFKRVLESANSFIVRMLPGDRTAIASFSDRFHLSQNFTSDRDLLLKHLTNEFNVHTGPESRLYEGMEDSLLVLEKEQNRRVLLVISDGKQWSAQPSGRHITPATIVTHALIKDVMIYGIPMWSRFKINDEAPSGGLKNMAVATGGGAFEIREGDNVAAIFSQVSKELHQQYLLGFEPQVLDGKTHKLEVRVTRPVRGVRVRARPSYVAPLAEKQK